MKKNLLLLFFLGLSNCAISQCTCVNCPFPTISNSTVTDTIFIVGAANNVLGSGGQDLQKICITFVDDAIEEKEIILESPSGDQVTLALNSGISVGDNITFDICWVACSETAMPDVGFPANFDTNAGWVNNSTYTGCYFPWSGCLEDFAGAVDGPWVLKIIDHIFLDDAIVSNWTLSFYDDTGLNCTEVGPCIYTPPVCEAYGGELSNPPVVACQGDAALNIPLTPTFPGAPQPPFPEYDYYFVVYDAVTNVLVSISPGTNYTGLNPGSYTVCGISFQASQAGLLPTPNGSYTFSDLNNFIASGAICADLSATCISITVEGTGMVPTIMGNAIVCQGAIESYVLNPPLNPGESYLVTATNGTILNQTGNTVEVEWDASPGNGTLCVSIVGGLCPSQQTCIQLIISSGFQLPAILDAPAELCFGALETIPFPEDPDILTYNWTGTGITFISGQGTSEIEFTIDQFGTIELCLEITTICGPQGPLCKTINIVAPTVANVLPVVPFCGLTFTLEAIIIPGSTVIWEHHSGPGTSFISQPFSPITQVTVTELGMYEYLFTETGACQDEIVVPVNVIGEPIVTTPIFTCNLNNEFVVSFNILDGNAPYSVDGIPLAGSVFVSANIPSGSSFSFLVEDASGCQITVADTFICPCQSFAGTVPSNTLDVCDEPGGLAVVLTNGDAIFETDDIGVYILHDNPTNLLGNIIDQNTTGIFSFLPGMSYNTTYYVSFVVGNDLGGIVDITDPCLSVSAGQPVIFYEFPSLEFIVPNVICELNFEIDAMSQIGIDNFFWNFVTGPGTANFLPIDAFPTTIAVSEPGLYTFSVSMFNAACIAVQEVDVFVLPPPEIIATLETCDLAGGTYTVSFEVTGGDPPYTADFGGSFNGNIFTSDPILTGEAYVITVTDVNGCESIPVIGVKLCDCFTDAGNMDLNAIELCGTTDPAQGISQGNEMLDTDDIGMYYLHDGDMNALGSVIDINDTGLFDFQSGMSLDTWYYISFVAGNDDMGMVDLLDPCLDVSVGQPVIWNSVPVADAGIDIFTCDSEFILQAQPDQGQWSSVDLAVSFDNATDPNSVVNLSDFGAYELIWNAQEGFCSDADTTIIFYQEGPQIISQLTECSDDLLTYVLTLELDGNNAPYDINGTTVLSSTFVSLPLSSTDVSSFTITDVDGCDSVIEVGPINCACTNDAGTVNQTDITLCEGDALLVDISNFDFITSLDDTVAFILHDGTSSPLGNIIEISYGDPIDFSSSLNTGQTYYLNVATGQWTGSGIDISDPCLAVSDGVFVVWNAIQSVTISGDHTVCIGQNADLEIVSDGPFPYDLTIANDAGISNAITITQTPQTITINPTQEQEIWNIVEVLLPCHSINGSTSINVVEPDFVTLINGATVCNNPLVSPQIILDDLFVGDIYPGEWFTPGLTAVNGIVSFDGVPSGEYIFTYSTSGFQDPCLGTDYNITITVEDCDCPMLNFGGPFSICDSGQNLSLDDYNVQGWNGFWTVLNPNNLDDPIFIAGNSVIVSGSTPGSYTMQYEITDPLLDECDDTFTFDVELEGYLQAGLTGEVLSFCQGEDVIISLYDLIENFDQGGEWFYTGDPIAEVLEINTLAPGIIEYLYVIPPGANCPGDQVTGSIEVFENPQIAESAFDVNCFEGTDGSIAIDVLNDNGGPYIFSLDGGNISEEGIFEDLSAGSYDIMVEDDNGCTSSISSVVLMEPSSLMVDIGPDHLVFVGSELTLTATLNIDQLDINSIIWSNDEGVLLESDLVLNLICETDQVINIEIVDINGCATSDQLIIKVKQKNIYIPNIFNPNSIVGNDLFGIPENSGVEEIARFSIYDRWGNLVFHVENVSPDSSNTSWDGKLLGKPVVQGVYVYLLDVRFPNGETDSFSGDITVLRGK